MLRSQMMSRGDRQPAVLLITRKRSSVPKVSSHVDQTPPLDELITASCSSSGSPSTRADSTYRSPSVQYQQNLFFMCRRPRTKLGSQLLPPSFLMKLPQQPGSSSACPSSPIM